MQTFSALLILCAGNHLWSVDWHRIWLDQVIGINNAQVNYDFSKVFLGISTQCLRKCRSIAQIDSQCLQQYELFYRATNGRSLCIHSAPTAMRVPSSCLLWATCERTTPRWPLCDCFEHAQNFMASMRGLNVLCVTLERPRQHFCVFCTFKGDVVSFVIAQGRHKGRSPRVEGVLLAVLIHQQAQSWPQSHATTRNYHCSHELSNHSQSPHGIFQR